MAGQAYHPIAGYRRIGGNPIFAAGLYRSLRD